jgi:hypothetical protein
VKIKPVKGQFRITFDRQDWSFALLALAKYLEEPQNQEVLQHWRNNLDERSWDLLDNAMSLSAIPIYLERDQALAFSDDLVEALFPPVKAKTKHLKLARICVDCQSGYVAEEAGHNDCRAVLK